MNNARGRRLAVVEWLVLCALAVVFMAVWFKAGYPQFSAIDLSVGKKQAVEKAAAFLGKRGIAYGKYTRSVVFESDDWADTYLQKTRGLEGEEDFVRDNGYELFSWKVRFFRQFEKEEYVVAVSPRTGGVVSFSHMIPDIEARETLPKEAAAARAAAFLRENGLDFNGYDFNEEQAKRFDNRTDYSFSWKKKDVSLPWKTGKGGAKLISGVTVSGTEISAFYIKQLDLPEEFYRYIDHQMLFGEYISSFSQLLFGVLIIFALASVLRRRGHVSMRYVRNRVLVVAAVLAAVQFLSLANTIEEVIDNYSTSASLSSFIGIYFLQSVMGVFFLGVIFAIPVLAGESLQAEEFPRSRGISLSHYFLSSFFTRSAAGLVLAGYLLFLILLGLQAGIFALGQQYLGVWKHWIKLTQFSSAVLPFFGAFAVGITASLTEEAVFRLFGITWGKKVFRSTVAAIIFSSVAWGFGHTQYAIFPIWFRGIEVSLIGLVYGLVFLRFGLIPLITAHYLFDVFWGVSPYMLGKSSAHLFAGSVAVLALPLLFAIAAAVMNRDEKEREIGPLLDRVQKFNLGVLETFVRERRAAGMPVEAIREELVSHHWDVSLVELALSKV